MKELDLQKFRFVMCFEIVAWRYKSYKSKVYDKVFGAIYRYSQLNDGVCYASVRDTLAPAIGVTPKVFGEALEVLIEDKLVTVVDTTGVTHKYTPNIEKLEELYSDRERGVIYEEKNKKEWRVRELLLRGEVVTTSVLEELLPQSEVVTTSKDIEIESLKEIPQASEKTIPQPQEDSNNSSIKEDFLNKLGLDESVFTVPSSKESSELPSSDSLEVRVSKALSNGLDKRLKLKLQNELIAFQLGSIAPELFDTRLREVYGA